MLVHENIRCQTHDYKTNNIEHEEGLIMTNTNHESNKTTKHSLSRRTFLKGLGIASAAGVASAALSGCAASPSSAADKNESATAVDAVTQRLIDRGIAGASHF